MTDPTFTHLATTVRTLTPDQRLRACADAHLDLRTLCRIRSNKPVRHSSAARLATALRELGLMEAATR